MSEAEKKKRQRYKENRRRWIIVQIIILAVVAIAIAASAAAYTALSRTYYINYSEKSGVDYKVQYKPNSDYADEWQPEDQAYVAELISTVLADFEYELVMQTAGVDYDYVYSVDATLEVVDNTTGRVIFHPTDAIVEQKRFTESSGENLTINEEVSIDYPAYNDRAYNFINQYGLNNSTATLKVEMHVDVMGKSATFVGVSENSHTVALNIPLAAKTLDIEMTSSVPQGEGKVLASNNGANPVIFGRIAMGASVGEVLLVLLFVAFVLLTRNDDINYTIKVKKLYNTYRSFIQRVTNGFDVAGYQVLNMGSFDDMLSIRDTIQSPILMSENEDQTCTQFFIPTNTNLLYMFEIRVDNYDEIYGTDTAETTEQMPEAEELPAEDVVVVADNTAADESYSEPLVFDDPAPEEQAAPVEVEISEIEDSDDADDAADEPDDDDKHAYGNKYDYSFEARLALATDETKDFYKQIVAFAKSYGVKVARSWKRERIYLGRKLFAVLVFRGTKLAIALAMDPTTADPKYHAKDLSEFKKYEKTPMLMRVTSDRKVSQAIELLTALFTEAGIKDKALGITLDEIPYRSRKQLILAGLIKTEVDPETLEDIVIHKTSPEITREDIAEALHTPTVELESIDYVDEVDEEYDDTPEHPGVDVIGVVWPERAHKNKIYRYDPDGEVVEDGDIVLVPTTDKHKNGVVVRKAAVAHGNHKVDPETLKHPLKRIIAVVRRKLESTLTEEDKGK